jgi:hypothetical protein
MLASRPTKVEEIFMRNVTIVKIANLGTFAAGHKCLSGLHLPISKCELLFAMVGLLRAAV